MDRSHNNTQTINIVNEFIRLQLHDRGYKWTINGAHPISNQLSINDRNICLGLQKMAEVFNIFIKDIDRHGQPFYEIISFLDGLNLDEAKAAFISLANELFSGDIRWSHIITFLVTGTELAYNCAEKNNEHMISCISEWIVSYIDSQLSSWIQQNGGWERIIYLEQREAIDGNRSVKSLVRYSVAAAGLVAAITIYLCIKAHK